MADIQPRTSPDPENNPPKKQGRPKGSKNKSATNTDSVAASKSKKSTKKRLTAQPDVPPPEWSRVACNTTSAVTELSVRIDWTTDRIDALINGITGNPEIKQGLFPSPGTVVHDQYGNIVKANSKPKTEYNWKLAKVVFEFDADYADVFMLTTGATAGQNYWAGKIKNKLEEMIEKVNKYKNEMGETGAGLTSAEQIDMSLTNGFTTKWAQIREDCPYFFEVRNLLGERPNQTPKLLDGLTKLVDTSDGEGSISEGSDEEDEIEENDKSRKRPKVNDKKFGPKRGKSTPAASNIKVARKRKQTALDRFVEIEKEAKQTDRERLRNQHAKAQHESDLAVAKVQAKAQVKVAQSKAKMDFALAKRQMEMDHEYREMGNSKGSGGSKGRNAYGSGPLLNEWMPAWEASQNDASSLSSPLFSGGDNMPFLGGDTDDTLYHNKDI
ncbi:hypothetical protein K435DRAFT_866582 [Dendrothele bispora CBS 962.96]|uniref:No apical meristem-associated C-terminal domain-containing protein n=1 Tax=Dendrothele bispora (strain CBS 962.96) TaxID=1314807 RepID=A0A4S8LHQ8_DENBC|nr:hypothetical protein K435DRAFT_866582 [Dendrothele bispora CBS 962.96]